MPVSMLATFPLFLTSHQKSSLWHNVSLGLILKTLLPQGGGRPAGKRGFKQELLHSSYGGGKNELQKCVGMYTTCIPIQNLKQKFSIYIYSKAFFFVFQVSDHYMYNHYGEK